MAYTIALANTLPAPYNTWPRGRIRISIGGSGVGENGNKTMQVGTPPTYGDAHTAGGIVEFPRNGIVVSNVPYTFTSDETLTRACQRTKEEIANSVERGVVQLLKDGVVQTPAQIRAL